MFRCPFCKAPGCKTVDSRSFEEGEAIRRRRRCLHCNKSFITFERIEAHPLFVLKRDGFKEVFDRNKILEGLLRAGVKRQIPMQTFHGLVDELEREFRCKGMRDIDSELIGKKVLEKLLPIDEVAYVRYASVFYRFKDIEEFKQELDKYMFLRKRGSTRNQPVTLAPPA